MNSQASAHAQSHSGQQHSVTGTATRPRSEPAAYMHMALAVAPPLARARLGCPRCAAQRAATCNAWLPQPAALAPPLGAYGGQSAGAPTHARVSRCGSRRLVTSATYYTNRTSLLGATCRTPTTLANALTSSIVRDEAIRLHNPSARQRRRARSPHLGCEARARSARKARAPKAPNAHVRPRPAIFSIRDCRAPCICRTMVQLISAERCVDGHLAVRSAGAHARTGWLPPPRSVVVSASRA